MGKNNKIAVHVNEKIIYYSNIYFLIKSNEERTGAVVKPRTLGREVPGSSPPIAVRCGLEQVTYPQLLR